MKVSPGIDNDMTCTHPRARQDSVRFRPNHQKGARVGPGAAGSGAGAGWNERARGIIALVLGISAVGTVVACSTHWSQNAAGPRVTAASVSTLAPSSTATSSTTQPTSSSACSLVPTPQIVRTLKTTSATAVRTSSGCQWFAPDASTNASLAVRFFPTRGAAMTTFQSERQFSPGEQPYSYGDAAYITHLAAKGAFPRQGVVAILIDATIVTAVVDAPATSPIDVVSSAEAIGKSATLQVRNGWTP